MSVAKNAPYILIVEDDPDLREMVGMVLENSGYAIEHVSNGQQGLKQAAEHLPSLVLLDMRMVGMNGWEFARAFREEHGRATPLVVFTAAPDAAAVAEEVEADGYLPKPFQLDQLLATIARFVPPPAGQGALTAV